jgi:hypothetical protein
MTKFPAAAGSFVQPLRGSTPAPQAATIFAKLSPIDPALPGANGATDSDIAEILGVCVRTLYRWRAEHV